MFNFRMELRKLSVKIKMKTIFSSKKFRKKKILGRLLKMQKLLIKKQKNILKHRIKLQRVGLQEINRKVQRIIILLILIKAILVLKVVIIGKLYLIIMIILL